MVKAYKIDQVFGALLTQPLEVEDLEHFYVPTAEARGKNPILRIEKLLNNRHGENLHILLAGYKGCGKSTELNRLISKIEDEYLIVKFSAMDHLNPVHLSYVDLFIGTMEQLFNKVDEYRELYENVSAEYLDSIRNWVGSKEVQSIKDKHFSLEGEAGAEIGIPYLKLFFAKFRAAVKNTDSIKETITKTIEPKLSALLDQCNDLIREVKLHLLKINRKDLVIIIEDLDKIPIDRSQELFYIYAQQITSLQCHVIYTFPIPLLYNIRFTAIAQYFDQDYVLPMVKIYDKQGEAVEAGRQVLREMVAKRMELSLFEKPELLERMIYFSGGVLRDLFSMIHEAAGNADEFGRETITERDYLSAYQNLKKDYKVTLSSKISIDDGVVTEEIPVQDYIDALVALAKNPLKDPPNTQVVLDLRQNLCILGYNGDHWCDVHPMVKEILLDRKLLTLEDIPGRPEF